MCGACVSQLEVVCGLILCSTSTVSPHPSAREAAAPPVFPGRADLALRGALSLPIACQWLSPLLSALPLRSCGCVLGL